MSNKNVNPRNNPQPSACEAAQALLGAYSIGALTRDEARFVEAMLKRCPGLQAELNDYLEIEQVMRHTVPDDETPPPVEALLARIEAEAEPEAAPEPVHHRTVTHPPKIVEIPVRRHSHNHTGYTHTVDHLRERLRTLPTSSSEGGSVGRWRSLTIAGLLAALLLLTNMWWFFQLEDVRQQQRELAAALNAQQIRIGTALRRIDLVAPEAHDGAPHALVTWDEASQVGSVVALNFPPLPQEMVYQIWAIKDGEPFAVGQFRPHEDGSGTLLFEYDLPLQTFDKMGISPEMPGHTLVPTNPHLVVGDV